MMNDVCFGGDNHLLFLFDFIPPIKKSVVIITYYSYGIYPTDKKIGGNNNILFLWYLPTDEKTGGT